MRSTIIALVFAFASIGLLAPNAHAQRRGPGFPGGFPGPPGMPRPPIGFPMGPSIGLSLGGPPRVGVGPSYSRGPGISLSFGSPFAYPYASPYYGAPNYYPRSSSSLYLYSVPRAPVTLYAPSASRVPSVSSQYASPSYSGVSPSYSTARPSVPSASTNSSDLRPGMVLPDGAIVVSVGPTGAPASGASASPAAGTSATGPTPAPPEPIENVDSLPEPVAPAASEPASTSRKF